MQKKTIFYKEHPSSFNPLKFGYQKRSLEYYQKISSLSKVVFIDTNYDSFKLIQKSDFVATISGQIGFEALLDQPWAHPASHSRGLFLKHYWTNRVRIQPPILEAKS